MKKRTVDTYKLAMVAMLAAISSVLMMLGFSVPLMPSFIKLDFSELPAVIAAFAMGPGAGALVCFLKNLINLLFTATGGIGELANFLIGLCLVVPAGLVYKYRRTHGGAVIACVVGAVCMAVLGFFINLFLIYPLYSLIIPKNVMLQAYQAILPAADSLAKALAIFNVPFTLFKASLSMMLTMLIYKPLSPLIKGTRFRGRRYAYSKEMTKKSKP